MQRRVNCQQWVAVGGATVGALVVPQVQCYFRQVVTHPNVDWTHKLR